MGDLLSQDFDMPEMGDFSQDQDAPMHPPGESQAFNFPSIDSLMDDDTKDQEKRDEMEKLFNKAYEALREDVDEESGKDFIRRIEEEYHADGNLISYYRKLAKLDALKWMKRHKAHLLDDLKPPDGITLSILYDSDSDVQPEALDDFFTQAHALVREGLPEKRRREEQQQQQQQQRRRQQDEDEGSGWISTKNHSKRQKGENEKVDKVYVSAGTKEKKGVEVDQEYKEEVIKNAKITNTRKFLDEGLKFDERQTWITVTENKKLRNRYFEFRQFRNQDAKRQSRNPKIDIFTTRKKGGRLKRVEDAPISSYLERVFGVFRVVLSKKATDKDNTQAYFRNKEELQKYEAAHAYWEKMVGGSFWGQKPGGVGKLAAHHTPYDIYRGEGAEKITYVSKEKGQEGEIVTIEIQKDDAPKQKGGVDSDY